MNSGTENEVTRPRYTGKCGKHQVVYTCSFKIDQLGAQWAISMLQCTDHTCYNHNIIINRKKLPRDSQGHIETKYKADEASEEQADGTREV